MKIRKGRMKIALMWKNGKLMNTTFHLFEKEESCVYSWTQNLWFRIHQLWTASYVNFVSIHDSQLCLWPVDNIGSQLCLSQLPKALFILPLSLNITPFLFFFFPKYNLLFKLQHTLIIFFYIYPYLILLLILKLQ